MSGEILKDLFDSDMLNDIKDETTQELLKEKEEIEKSEEINAFEKGRKKLLIDIKLKLLGHSEEDEENKEEDDEDVTTKQENMGDRTGEIVSEKDIFDYIKRTILKTESNGNHGAVNPFDVNGVSLGLIQRHKERARDLCRELYETDEELFTNTMGSEFTEQMTNDVKNKKLGTLRTTKWDKQKVERFKKLMENKNMQNTMDNKANTDIQGYIQKTRNRGITNTNSLIYMSSIMNGGSGRAEKIVENAGDKKNDVNELHKQALQSDFGKVIAKVLEKKKDRAANINQEDIDLPMAA